MGSQTCIPEGFVSSQLGVSCYGKSWLERNKRLEQRSERC